MTLKETTEKINMLQHLVGENVPQWNSPIIEMIPAPADATFTKYIEAYKKTGNYEKAILKVRSDNFDILLVFRTPKLHSSLVCEWYGFFYPNQKRPAEKIINTEFELKESWFEKNSNRLLSA
jgi:hypothetical protein